MRVIYLHQYFTMPQMPGGTRSYEVARRLVAAGHEVTMLTSSARLGSAWAPRGGWHSHVVEGIHLEVVGVPYSNAMPFRQRVKAFLCFALSALWHARKHKADVVLATSTPLTIAIPGLGAKLWHRIPMVFEVRDLWPELPIAVGALRDPVSKGLARLLEWVAYHASAHTIALSSGMAEGVIRRGISASRVTVIPNGCDVDLFDVPAERGNPIRQRLGMVPRQPLIVYAGTFGLINGVSYLVELAAAMRTIAPDVRFLLVGTGAELERVTQQAQERGVLNRSLWIWEPIPKAEMPNLLAAAAVATSVFAPLDAMWSNSANKFFDALAARRPVAINYGGWQAELLRETGAGIVLPANDPAAAARMLAEFLSDRDRLMRAREAARHLAESRFNRDLLFEEFERVLLLAAKDGSSP